MADTLITPTGTPFTLDETAGLQNSTATPNPPNPAGDADDNDVLVSTLPSAFSTRLIALGFDPDDAIGAAASNGNVVTFNPTGTLGNIALTGAGGVPLDGVDSGIDTTDGEDIFLYTDTNDNIVLGRAGGEDGPVVFAIYLEETGGPPPTGAKLWSVLYESLLHDDPNNPDDPDQLDLTGLVHVTAFEEQTFSFSNAPSGQNLFMAFGSSTQALLVTGEDPADESAGQNVSNAGDTVNTGKGGGDTTLGTEGQQIKAQKALVVTFVSGADPDLLVPNLDPGEAGVESNIQFTGYVLAQAAEITISQMTPGGPSTTATVELEAYVTADAAGDGYINNDPLVTGDTPINIDTVQVIRNGVDVVGTLGVSVDFTGSTAVITGVKDDDIIRYTTDADHNRVLIRNDQPASGSGSNVTFDLGGFTLTEVAGDTEEVGAKIVFEDDGPSITTGTNPAALTVDETTLGTDASGSFANLFSVAFGADGPKDTDGVAGEDADAVTYALGIGVVGANSGLFDTATGNSVFLFLSADGTTITGKEGTDLADADSGETVFVISVNADTGVVSLDQQRAVIHTPDTGPDQAVTLADNVITLTATATDGDLDTAIKTEDVGDRFTFEDDAPSAGANTAVQLDDETAQSTRAAPNLGGTDDAIGTSATAMGTLDNSFGADGAGTVLLTGATLPASGGFSQDLSLDEKTLTISQIQNGVSVDVVKIELTNATGAYTVTHLAQVFHPTPGTTEEDVTFTVAYEVTDQDGDTAQSSINILADDDTPTIAAGTNPTALTVDESVLATNASGSFANLFSVAFGADGPKDTDGVAGEDADAVTYALGIGVVGANSGLFDTATGNSVFLFLSADGTTITGKEGTDLADADSGETVFVISVNADTGVVSLDQQRAVIHTPDTGPDQAVTLADGVITLTATAKDGDLDTAGRTENVGDRFTFKDDAPLLTVADATGTYDEGATGNWDHNPGADGFGSLSVNFDSYLIDGNGTVVVNAALAKTGDFAFEGSITDDFNGDGTDETVDFTLTFDPDNPETYELEITTPPATITKFDTSQGTLKAGGPDPVQTLLFGGSETGLDDIVFFSVVPTAPPTNGGGADPNDLLDLVVSGETDLTEDDIEDLSVNPNPNIIDIPGLIIPGAQMNVSTSGIGVNNNNLNGAADLLETPAFANTSITSGDESFIVNPETVVDQVRVFIDNSVGGYTPNTEDLYYTVYYTDGTVSAPTDVTNPINVPLLDPNNEFPNALQGHGQYFDIVAVDDKQIDAVQLTMGRGTIKVPVIQFSVEQVFDPEPLRLDFTATLVDGDGDNIQDPFKVDLSSIL